MKTLETKKAPSAISTEEAKRLGLVLGNAKYPIQALLASLKERKIKEEIDRNLLNNPVQTFNIGTDLFQPAAGIEAYRKTVTENGVTYDFSLLITNHPNHGHFNDHKLTGVYIAEFSLSDNPDKWKYIIRSTGSMPLYSIHLNYKTEEAVEKKLKDSRPDPAFTDRRFITSAFELPVLAETTKQECETVHQKTLGMIEEIIDHCAGDPDYHNINSEIYGEKWKATQIIKDYFNRSEPYRNHPDYDTYISFDSESKEITVDTYVAYPISHFPYCGFKIYDRKSTGLPAILSEKVYPDLLEIYNAYDPDGYDPEFY